MKKTAKATLKKGKAAPVAKKAIAKKPVVKIVAKKPAAKKPEIKKHQAKHVAKKLPAKITLKKPEVKKPLVIKTAVNKGKSQGGLQKKIQDKIAASKKVAMEKAAKKAPFDKKANAKKIEQEKRNEKVVKEKMAAKVEKEVKGAKIAKPAPHVKATRETKGVVKGSEKEVEKISKKLSKKEEKELLKSKNKKSESFEDEEIEDSPRKRFDEDEEEDDFETVVPQKVKMTFDEDIEEDIIPARKKNKVSIDDDVKDNLAEEILALSEDFSIDEIFASIRNMELFKIETDECVVRGCDNPATTSGHCRYHYIKLWKDVQKKQLILSEGRLAKIVEDLVRKYPVKFIETIIQDLADDKAFNSVLKDLDIETDEAEIEGFDDDELLDDDQDIAFETKVVKPSFDD